MINLNKKSSDLAAVEKKIIELAKGNFKGSYNHWSILNTINHTYSWKRSSLEKVELRIVGEEVLFHSDESLESINSRFYEKTKDYSKKITIETIDRFIDDSKELIRKINGNETSKELAPVGFNGSVYDYLLYDFIFHPINHYLFYSIKNDEFDIFLRIENYINDNRNVLFNDLGIVNLKELMCDDRYEEIFNKRDEWEHNDLYLQIKENTL